MIQMRVTALETKHKEFVTLDLNLFYSTEHQMKFFILKFHIFSLQFNLSDHLLTISEFDWRLQAQTFG